MLLLIAFLLTFFVPNVSSTRITINNTAPRLDVNGQIMDAHDLSLRVLPDGTFIMHTIEYGLCIAPSKLGCDSTPDHCGFRGTHNITVWTSPDLSSGSWTKHGNAFELAARPAGLIFRPDAIFNPDTQLWVLWFNLASGGNTYVTCVSKSPFGPFSDFQTSNVTDATWTGGDFHLFRDETPTGAGQPYVVFTGMSKAAGLDHKIRITQLTRDMRNAAPGFDAYMFSETFTEAPAVFYQPDVNLWYAIFGHCCCFCEQGSGLMVHTATSPSGPYTLQVGEVSDIACQAAATTNVGWSGEPTPGQGCLYGGSTQVSVTRSQSDFIAVLPNGSNGSTILYFGSRWGQSPDGIKGHEPQYLTPLTFNGSIISHIVWEDLVSFDVQTAMDLSGR